MPPLRFAARVAIAAIAIVAAIDSAAGAAIDSTWIHPKSDDPCDVNVPHAPHDTLRFETDRGTWMSVDVSPDGRTLVFDLLGDLYTLPVAGGRAKRLTSGLA